MRSCGSPISSTAHITFCTFDEVFRPQTLINAVLPTFDASPDPGGQPSEKAVARAREATPPFEPPCPARIVSGGYRHSLFDLPRFLRQHDRNAVADRVGELGGARDELLLLPVVFEWRFGQRTDQDFQELRIDNVALMVAG